MLGRSLGCLWYFFSPVRTLFAWCPEPGTTYTGSCSYCRWRLKIHLLSALELKSMGYLISFWEIVLRIRTHEWVIALVLYLPVIEWWSYYASDSGDTKMQKPPWDILSMLQFCPITNFLLQIPSSKPKSTTPFRLSPEKYATLCNWRRLWWHLAECSASRVEDAEGREIVLYCITLSSSSSKTDCVG